METVSDELQKAIDNRDDKFSWIDINAIDNARGILMSIGAYQTAQGLYSVEAKILKEMRKEEK